jgi:hypothetical protein
VSEAARVTPTFSERNWQTRKSGDFFYFSEGKFEKFWDGPYAHFGLGEQTENMATWKLSPFLSHTPDYIAALHEDATPVLVEVQGTGLGGATEDGTLVHKFKQKKLEHLGKWNTIQEVTFWLWNDADETWVWTSYASIRLMIAQGKATEGSFDGMRPYWAIPVADIVEAADTARLMDKYA